VAHLPPGWATDLAVLELGGSLIEDRRDHLVVTTPTNPDFHWGNFVLVTDTAAVDDAPRWVATFHDEFPHATWVAIGLIRIPDDVTAWAQQNIDVEHDDVLTTVSLPRRTPCPDGYEVRRLDGEDWEQSVAFAVSQNATAEDHEPVAHERFVRARMANQRALSGRGSAAFFGAFDGDEIVAELGIVRCAARARYQNVATEPRHRRRGLASHLLGVAAEWSADRGCHEWVIVTEATNLAGRVYRRAGFTPDFATAEAYRPPPRHASAPLPSHS
jgi:GNAT superfamily N-acetyltransferase